VQKVNLQSVQNSKVFCRVDFDVPLKQGKIQNTYRIDRCLPTIQSLLKNNNKVVLFTKLGRPQGAEESLSTKHLLPYLNKAFSTEVSFIDSLNSLSSLSSQVSLFENTRFFSWEKDLNEDIAKELASFFDFYVDEAFAMSHREETTNFLVPRFIGKVSLGLNYSKEVSFLGDLLKGNFKKPATFVLGGAKPDTKIPMINALLPSFDYFLVGGLLAKELSLKNPKIIKAYLTPDGFDITKESASLFSQIIKESQTIVFNGPMGMFEDERYIYGTFKVVEAIAKSKASLKIAGGGDTINAISLYNHNAINTFTFISTGGGAMFNFLKGGKTNLQKLKISLS